MVYCLEGGKGIEDKTSGPVPFSRCATERLNAFQVGSDGCSAALPRIERITHKHPQQNKW